jgi:tRNA-dihydrouridine synthase
METILPNSLHLKPLELKGTRFDPPLFLAPMANLTHSALRRLMADYGGYGAVFTEMLSAKMILHEDFKKSPWLKRRPQEGKVFYQLLVTDPSGLPDIIARLSELQPDGLDLNCACAAPTILQQHGGAALFEETERMATIVRILRRCFTGPLTVKIRLGRRSADWWNRLMDRIHVLESEGVDALILHPRFIEEKFRRVARHELYGDIAAHTPLPLIANGDIAGVDFIHARAAHFACVSGFMIGRRAIAQPWLFGRWHNPDLAVDYAEMVRRLCGYLAEDFSPDKAMRRLKVWTPYFACNFVYGHTLFKAVQAAPDWDCAVKRLQDFLATDPERLDPITVDGL